MRVSVAKRGLRGTLLHMLLRSMEMRVMGGRGEFVSTHVCR